MTSFRADETDVPLVLPVLDFLKSQTKPSQIAYLYASTYMHTYIHTCIHTYIYSCACIQLILIHRFHICEFAYVPEFLCDPPNQYSATSRSFVKKLSLPAEVNRDDTAFLFQLLVCKQVSFTQPV